MLRIHSKIYQTMTIIKKEFKRSNFMWYAIIHITLILRMFIKYKNDMPSKRNNLKVDKLSAFDDSENICYNFDSQIYNAHII